MRFSQTCNLLMVAVITTVCWHSGMLNARPKQSWQIQAVAPIQIKSVTYGGVSSFNGVDFATVLQGKIGNASGYTLLNEKWSTPNSFNAIFGDPNPGTRKTLTIVYSINRGADQTVSRVEEAGSITLRVPTAEEIAAAEAAAAKKAEEVKQSEENKAFLAEIANTLDPKGPRPSWAQPRIRDEFDRLRFQISGFTPDALFSENKIEKFSNWLSKAVNKKNIVPVSLKRLFSQKLALLVKQRPSYKNFTTENKDIPADRISELKPLLERLGNAFDSLLNNVLKTLKNNPLFSHTDYTNKDDDIAAIENEIKLINQAISQLK